MVVMVVSGSTKKDPPSTRSTILIVFYVWEAIRERTKWGEIRWQNRLRKVNLMEKPAVTSRTENIGRREGDDANGAATFVAVVDPAGSSCTSSKRHRCQINSIPVLSIVREDVTDIYINGI